MGDFITWGRKTGGRNFTKGKKWGPGAPGLPAELKQARALNNREAEKSINKFLYMPLRDLVEFIKDQSNTVHEMLIARILLEAIKQGDHSRLEWIYQRLLGKVRTEIDVTQTSINATEALLQRWREIDPRDHVALIKDAKVINE